MKSRDRVPLPEKEFEVKLEAAEKDALKVVVKFLYLVAQQGDFLVVCERG